MPNCSRHSGYKTMGGAGHDMSTLDLQKAAALANCHPNTLRQMMKDGEAPGTKIGRAWVVTESTFMAWLDRRCQSTDEQAQHTSGSEGQSLAESIANHRAQRTRDKLKNLSMPSEIGSGAGSGLATRGRSQSARQRSDG